MASKESIKLANKEDVPLGKSLTVHLNDGRQIVLFNSSGEIYALENICPHMGGPLGEGEFDNCLVTCPWHGWQFNVKTGECINVPGDDATTIPLEIHNNEIFLTIPND